MKMAKLYAGRMAMSDNDFVRAVQYEIARARKKFPDSQCSAIALMEEVGELAKALLEEDWSRVEEEAIQVAVMAQRVAIDGDRSVTEYRDAIIAGRDK